MLEDVTATASRGLALINFGKISQLAVTPLRMSGLRFTNGGGAVGRESVYKGLGCWGSGFLI
jgi:hypothetical protein